ncbi:MAG: thioredoxin family protein [Planctomycetota bacterium]|nr:thioredoxin family protein [Planctomycetota bacterium]
MPKPPQLPKIEYGTLWEAGQTWDAWLKACQGPAQDEMSGIYASAEVPADVAAALQGLKRPVHVLAIAEDWCGDVRRNTPVLAKVCAASPNVRLRLIDKENHPDVMVRYLTNGAEAIPIFLFFNDKFVEVGNWGPRPAACKLFMARGKGCGDLEAARAKIKEYYQADRHRTTVKELADLIGIAGAERV